MQKYFVTVAYPYPNSPQHIGHGRTYALADTHARYMRMRGRNVLFPMGFHYTGTPILGMSRRVAAGDTDLIETFRKMYKLSDEIISTFVEPIRIARYFHQEIKQGMVEMGYSIDWRREFTTVDPLYSQFISWQFRLLQKKGLIVRGSHPVGWCPRDQNPVSQHDTMGDVEPDFTEYTIVKFRMDGVVIPAATLRPETLFGVTNMWINPDAEYVHILVDRREDWIVTREAAGKLEFLNHTISIVTQMHGSELIGRTVVNPLTDKPVPIYPASFVEPDNGTGVVMSVPAHAPFDFHALGILKSDKKAQLRFNLSVDVEPIKIISSEVYGGIPAAEAIEKANSKSGSRELDVLEKATSDLYSNEFYKGKMMQNTGKFVGMSVSESKSLVKEELLKEGSADVIYELLNKPVRCRCGTVCVVKLLSDQWFLNYGDQKWKQQAHTCIREMDIRPDDIRQEFEYVIDWLKERACARKTGLGTPLPWDHEWIIESLSDSVIYMAYYILAKYVNSGLLVSTSKIDDSFFDFIFLGIGDAKSVAENCGIGYNVILEIRNEFQYFYPVDSRHSGRDLIPNHLTFFVFNHVAIFPKDNWPRQIVVNGSVLMDGKKMSKSLGNIIPLRDAIVEHSADAIRLAMLVSAELLQDADFSFETAKGIKSKLSALFALSSKVAKGTLTAKLEPEDRWLLSKIQRAVQTATSSLDQLRVREAVHTIVYSLDQDLQWYMRRTGAKGRSNSDAVRGVLNEYLYNQILMLGPLAPFSSEELWEKLGNNNSIASATWPEPRSEHIDLSAEEGEFLLENLISDLENILKVTKLTPSKVLIYTAAAWKYPIYLAILSSALESKRDFGETMRNLIANPETARAKGDPSLVKKLIEDILATPMDARRRRATLNMFKESSALVDGTTLISSETQGAQVLVYSEDDPKIYDPKSKAKSSRPFKPAIYLE